MPATAAACVLLLLAPLLPWWLARSGDPEAFGGLFVQLAGVAVGVLALQRPADPPSRARPSLFCGALLLLSGLLVDVRILQMGGVLCLAHAAAAIAAPERARSLLPPLLVLLLGLPLGPDLDVVGFPARLFAARVADSALALTGAAVTSAETVLVVEGDVADVEAPCAGLGTVRMLAAVVVVLAALRRSSTPRTLLALVVSAVVALAGNALRVTALALLVLVVKQPQLAAMVHVPLGVVVFVGAAVLADLLLRVPAGARPAQAAMGRADLAILVVVTLLASALRLTAPAPAAPPPPAPPSENAIPLTPAEEGLFARHALFAEKHHIPGGTVLVVVATSLRAHHAPERCLAGAGLRVDATTETTVQGIPVKRLTLNGGAQQAVSFYVRDDDGEPLVLPTLSARATDQLASRIAGEAAGPWAFVSAVVDGHAEVDVAALVHEAHARVQKRVNT